MKVLKKIFHFSVFHFSVLILFLSLTLTCCSKNENTAPLAKPNFILISLDTLRGDRLGLYGYKRDTSPNFDKLAKNAAVFLNASTVTSWTLPSHVSMLTGLYPSTHHVTQKKGNKIPSETPVLSEVLKAAGYRTFGFANGGYVSGTYGFKRGFEEYPRSGIKGIKNESEEMVKIYKEQSGTGVGAARAKEKILSLNNKEPFFIFIHTYDIHCPYDPPEPFLSMFKTEGRLDVDTTKCIPHEGSEKYKKEEVWTMSDRYDGNIRWVDDTFGKFFDWFNTTEAAKNTYIVITADHGEEFLEHNHLDHRESLYKELVHIPLMILGPGIKPGTYTNPISLVDIVPTALELLGRPSIKTDGVSFAELLKTGKSEKELPRWRFAELDRDKVLRSAYDDKSNLIVEHDEKTFNEKKKEYFFHPEDPNEQVNKFDLKDGKVSERYNELREKLKTFKPSDKPVVEDEGDTPENLEELKTLGYM